MAIMAETILTWWAKGTPGESGALMAPNKPLEHLEPLFPEDPPLPGPHTPRLPRPPHHRARPRERGLHEVSSDRDRCGAQSGGILACASHRVLPGDTPEERIEARGAARLGKATDRAAAAIAQRYGRGAVDGKIQTHIVTIEN
jgi:hypothetical protein